MLFGVSLQIWSVILILITLIIGVVDFYFTHIEAPKSEVIFSSRVAPDASPHSTIGGEIQMELYFKANNRGDDNAHIISAELDWIEFYNAQDSKDERHIVHYEELADSVYGQEPLVILHEGRDADGRAPIQILQGELVEIFIVIRIFSVGHLKTVKEDYENAKARIVFTVLDGEREYTVEIDSDSVDASKLEPP
ncbi:hypothetical protein [Haloarchaeobius iranensis]|uniref:hypothetical protein n=1 Tax=Haloarchaeobius iranensis TaxID=996166 RepID=UPI0011143DB7|nr:hypothetical protein [Haloarchaeobius iranensis]